MKKIKITNSNMYSQRGRWERGRSPVGGDCYHTILNLIFKMKLYIYYLFEVGAMAIAPYGYFKIEKHDNMPYFSHKSCSNVKIVKIV